MYKKLCSTCREEIPPTRLSAIENCETCVKCSTELPLQGIMTWEHKTAPTIHIGTQKEIEALQRFSRRGPRPQLPFSQRQSGPLFLEQKGKANTLHMAATNMLSATCAHKERQRVGPSGKCAECALLWYETRSKLKRR